jgi:hypothetical protein
MICVFISDPDPVFYLSQIPVPGVKKAPDPGSGYAAMEIKVLFINVLYNIKDKFDCFFQKFPRVERLCPRYVVTSKLIRSGRNSPDSDPP